MGCDNGQASDRQAAMRRPRKSSRSRARSRIARNYRLTHNVPYELWYDGQDRLVREEWVSTGHRSVLELTRVSR